MPVSREVWFSSVPAIGRDGFIKLLPQRCSHIDIIQQAKVFMLKCVCHVACCISKGNTDLFAAAQPGHGAGQGTGPGFRFNRDNTAGWSMMSAQERAGHRQKMISMKSYDERVAYMDEHHKLMQERASQKGKCLPAPKANACERMRSVGMLE